jgi:copper chaperone
MSTAGYLVEGMTCGRCVAKVLEKVRSLSGVTKVAMDLVAGGQSPLLVMSGTKLGDDVVRGAVESAGFGFLPPRGPEVHPRGDGPSAQEGEADPDRQRMRFSVGGVRS